MSTPDPAGLEGAVHFRVTGIDRYAFPDPVEETHMVLRVHYLNPEDRLRGATFDLPPDTYATYREAVDAAITSGATYWVILDPAEMASTPHPRGMTAVDRLLQAIADQQTVPSETKD